MLGASTEDLQKLVLTIGAGGVVGYFIANKYNKSKTLGVILGVTVTLGLLYAFRTNENKSRGKRMECDNRYYKLAQPENYNPQQEMKRKEEWMKINCK